MKVKNIRYADDAVLMAGSEDKIQEMVETLHGTYAAKGLHINFGRGKTEVMSLAMTSQVFIVNIISEGVRISKVESYKYLRAMVTKDGKHEGEVMNRSGWQILDSVR